MIIIEEIQITEHAKEIIEKHYEIKLDRYSGKELMKLLENSIEDIEGLYMEGNELGVWTEEDMSEICYIENTEMNSLYKINEFNCYTAQDICDGEYYFYSDESEVLDYYIGADDLDSEQAEKIFNKNLENIVWRGEDSKLEDAINNILNQIDNDTVGDDVIILQGNGWTSLEVEIEAEITDDYEMIGYFSGREIYRIKNRLYYLSDDSWVCNDEYYWRLQELGKNGYMQFGMESPKENK